MPIEQAIFTSAKTVHSAGYQLAARSAGVTDDEARELSLWGPSHGSLLMRANQPSVNFFGLSSGRYCVSRTVAAGQEYSARGGERIYTQFLIVDAVTLARFGNNPFSLLRAAWAKGVIRVHESVPSELPVFQLTGRARACDTTAIVDLHKTLGDERLGLLLHAALGAPVLAVTGASRVDQLFGALLNCLPVGYRAQVCFTTGLVFSPRRPFRWIAAPVDRTEQRQLERHHGVKVVDVSRDVEEVQLGYWAKAVLAALQTGIVNALAVELDAQLQPMNAEAVNSLGERLLSQFKAGGDAKSAATERVERVRSAAHPSAPTTQRAQSTNVARRSTYIRGHKPHAAVANAADAFVRPSASLGLLAPEAFAHLQLLDEAVVKLVTGAPAAADSVKRLWAILKSECSSSIADKAREAYIEFATELWTARSQDSAYNAENAAAALDVLCILFDE